MTEEKKICLTGPSRRAFLKAAAFAAAAAGLPGAVLAAGGTRVLAATYPACLACAALLENLSGFQLELLVAAQTGCPHDYAITPMDRMKLEEAEVLVLNGGGFESFLGEDLLAGLKARLVDAGRGIDLRSLGELPESDHDGDDEHEHKHEHEHVHAGTGHDHGHHHHHDGNPHYFSSPGLFAVMVANAAAGLAEVRPELADELSSRAQAFSERMAVLDEQIRALSGENVRLVLQHDTLAWFFRGSAFTVEAVLQEEGDEAPSAALLVNLARRISSSEQRFLLVGEPQFSSQVLDTLAAETGAAKVVLDPLVSGDLPVPPAYYETVMAANIETLKAVLAQ